MSAKERETNDAAGDAEELHRSSLMALLHEMVRKEGRGGAAKALGLDQRTVGACMDGGGMSWRVREALERALRERNDSAANRGREHSESLERRVEALEKQLRAGFDEVRAEVGAMREEAPAASGRRPVSVTPRRLYPDLVTKDPAPDDEEVYGAAWPLIEEWRRLWQSHSGGGKGLSWLRTEERVRELEVAMLEEHGLTLPPETEPLRGMWRSSQLNWRKETLRDVRRARARRELLRWVRRVLTLNLWRQ